METPLLSDRLPPAVEIDEELGRLRREAAFLSALRKLMARREGREEIARRLLDRRRAAEGRTDE